MNSQFDVDVCLQQFSGSAPLFPLPSAVLFPNLVLPLQVFEPRYCEMTADVLARDRLLALALLRPGDDASYHTKGAAIYPVVSLGQIVAHQRLDDGRYHILVRGVCRARLTRETPTPHAYRVGLLEPLKDVYPSQPEACWQQLQAAVHAAFDLRFPQLSGNAPLQRAVREELSLGVLCDLLCSSLPLSHAESAELLMEIDVRRRCLWLLQRMNLAPASSAGDRGFPPEFSVN
jgi:Lon protease-like protein